MVWFALLTTGRYPDYNSVMLLLFFGFTVANLLLLSGVFVLGMLMPEHGQAGGVYSYHILFAIAAGLMVVFTHLVVYTYFMATHKWLGAAVDKGNLDPAAYALASGDRKKRVFALAMTAITVTMLTMFAGAAADTIRSWPAMIHWVAALATLGINGACAVGEFQCIRAQSRLMDDALAALNANLRGAAS